MNSIRIGHGYDIHRLVPGRNLILGGIKIDYELGLDGHSDADVVCHAVMDALLGALALGDIGQHFPNTDSKYHNADSIGLLMHVNSLIRGRGFDIGNIDITIIAEKPRLSSYMDRMRNGLAGAMGISADQISLKATTNENIGLIGKGEGIAAFAVALLHK